MYVYYYKVNNVNILYNVIVYTYIIDKHNNNSNK